MNTANTIERVAKAIRTAMTSLSPHLGADCILHARFAQFLLRQQGVSSNLCVGEAAWRVGSGDSDVIVHSHRFGGFSTSDQLALPMHAWLLVQGRIFDCTTHSLREKARLLDLCDGGKTTVDWAPPYIWLDQQACKTLQEVTAAPEPGICFYRIVPETQQRVQAAIDRLPLDEDDLLVLRMIYANPDAVLVGPRDMAVA